VVPVAQAPVFIEERDGAPFPVVTDERGAFNWLSRREGSIQVSIAKPAKQGPQLIEELRFGVGTRVIGGEFSGARFQPSGLCTRACAQESNERDDRHEQPQRD